MGLSYLQSRHPNSWSTLPCTRVAPFALQARLFTSVFFWERDPKHASRRQRPDTVTACVPSLLRLVQICLRLVQTEALLLSKLGFPGLVQPCPDRVHMKPVCM